MDEELDQYGGSLVDWRGNSQGHFAHLRHLPEWDRIRLSRLMPVLRCDVDGWDSLIKPAIVLKRAESYVSSNGQTMLWSIWLMLSPAETVAAAQRLNAHRKAAGLLEYGQKMFR